MISFKLWLEAIQREDVKKIILDALGAGNTSPEQQGNILGSSVDEHPDLMQRLNKYSEIKPYLDQIGSYIGSNETITLIDLINFITQLGQSSVPVKQAIPSNDMRRQPL